MQFKKVITIFFHLLVWLAIGYIANQVLRVQFHTFHNLNGVRSEKTEVHTYSALIFTAVLFKMLPFYMNALPTFRRLLASKRWTAYMGYMLLTYSVVAGFEYVCIHTFIRDRPSFASIVWPELLAYIVVFGISMAYYLLREWDKAERRAQLTAAENVRAELDFLKAQIDPHFFLNTLNNLYSMAQAKGNDELEEGILQLSEMMRYILYECRAEKVMLTRELEYIRSYIGLTLARYRNDGRISVSLDADESALQHLRIAPVILMPFVENAFKHGISLEKVSSIQITMAANDDQFIFIVKNTNYSQKKNGPDHHGIGIGNVRRRLELLYLDQFTLDISNQNGIHTITLQLTDHDLHHH